MGRSEWSVILFWSCACESEGIGVRTRDAVNKYVAGVGIERVRGNGFDRYKGKRI